MSLRMVFKYALISTSPYSQKKNCYISQIYWTICRALIRNQEPKFLRFGKPTLSAAHISDELADLNKSYFSTMMMKLPCNFFKVSDGWTPYCMYIISLGFSFLGKNSECKRSEGFHTINIKMMGAYIIYMSTWIFGEIAPLSGMNGELTSAFDIFIHCPCIFFCTSLTPLSAKLLFWQC